MNCFKSTVLKNDTVTGEGFPALKPGENLIACTGNIRRLEIVPSCTVCKDFLGFSVEKIAKIWYNNLTKHNPNQRFGVFQRTLNHTASAQRAFATWYNIFEIKRKSELRRDIMKIANGMQFVNDEAVIGKWNNIGWIENTNCTSLDGLNEKSGEYDTIYFLPNGEPYWIFEGWTKGVLLIHYGGNEPILTYKYDIQVIDGKEYLFFRLKNKTEIFVKFNSKHYTKATLGRHDNIELPFVYDERITGKWKSVGFVDTMESFSSNNTCDNLYLKEIYFFSDGRLEQTTMDEVWYDKWTKGSVINMHRTTVAAYEIKAINGTEYLFMEWKMGNYIYGGKEPDFYVFVRA